jgi:hypothetical protein
VHRRADIQLERAPSLEPDVVGERLAWQLRRRLETWLALQLAHHPDVDAIEAAGGDVHLELPLRGKVLAVVTASVLGVL